VGQSGSGKTTLLQLLGGLDRPTSGSILLDGDDIGRMSSSKLTELRRRRIGFIFQSYHLFPELNSLENAVLPALHWGQDRDAAEKFVRELLSHFGLAGRLTHRPSELYGGEQQRVAIARALVNNPDIILADEPTGNLDRKAADDIIRIINDVRKDSGKTLVMVTHDQEMANRADAVFNLVPNRKRP
jgi:ABC-type lipoprotein export system ATPase subunit